MGVSGLLPQLRSITKRCHVSKYRGEKVAVDAYCLLHKGAYTCARELVEGEPTERHVAYCMARMELLLGAGVTPLVVFDGGRLPNKGDEERSRQRSREENRARARALWAAGNRTAAMECYQKAVDITPAHAKQFVEALKRRGCAFLVAPYEADAQMAYLALNGLVDAVLTEDSDLLCYGCPKVFFKMDKTGEGEEVQLCELPQARELAFQGFGHDLFQEMCVLAGCDFVDSLPGIGIKKAHQNLRRTRCFLKVVRALRFDGTKIPEGYERRVQRALWTFRHQRVYCPRRRAAVHLHEIPGGDLAAGARVPAAAQLVDGEPDFLGPALPDDVAQAIAAGDLDPITKQPFADELQPCTAPLTDDAAASGSASQRDAPPARQQQQLRSGRSKSGQQVVGAGNGTTLLNFGFVRGLAKPTQAEFKPPRPSSAPGSQDSAAGQPLQQQQQQAAASSSQEENKQLRQQGLGSPAPPKPAPAGDALASPTDEQWQSFRQRRHRASGRVLLAAPLAATHPAGKPPGPAGGGKTSSFFAGPKPSVSGMRKPAAVAAAGSGASLLARLQAALKPEEPSVDELLRGREDEADLPAEISVSIGTDDDEEQLQECQQAMRLGDGRARFVPPCRAAPVQQPASMRTQQHEEEGGQDAAEQQLEMGGPSRPRLVVPAKQRLSTEQGEQQQRSRSQPTSPLDLLGLGRSPTIDDVLGGGSAPAAERLGGQDEAEQLPSLACSPAQLPRPSQRLWLPQRSAAEQQQRQQKPLLDLVSPAGPLFRQPLQQDVQQQRQHQITPGFYNMEAGSDAGSGARPISSLPWREPADTPASRSPLSRRAAGAAGGSGAAGLQPCFDAAAPAAEGDGAPDLERVSPFASDPIASLGHLPAFQREAEAAVDRAAQTALAAASQAALRPLRPPPHLQPGKAQAAALAAGKRALLGVGEKENGQTRQAAGGSKRLKGAGTAVGAGAPAASNIFSGFACGSR